MTDLDAVAHAYLEEYRDLRGEIHQRVNNQLLVIGGNVALTAALVPVLAPFFAAGEATIILGVPIVFGIVAWLYFEQDVFLTQAATYLHRELRPRLAAHLAARGGGTDTTHIMGWERFRGERLFASWLPRQLLRAMTAFRIGATAGPGLGCLIAGAAIETSKRGAPWHWSRPSLALATVDVLIVAFTLFLGLYVVRLYRGISYGSSTSPPPTAGAPAGAAQTGTASTGTGPTAAAPTGPATAGTAPTGPATAGRPA